MMRLYKYINILNDKDVGFQMYRLKHVTTKSQNLNLCSFQNSSQGVTAASSCCLVTLECTKPRYTDRKGKRIHTTFVFCKYNDVTRTVGPA
jgi:hypothetical protein